MQQSTLGGLWATQTQTIYSPGWISGKEEDGEEEGTVILLLSVTEVKTVDAVAQTVALQTRW